MSIRDAPKTEVYGNKTRAAKGCPLNTKTKLDLNKTSGFSQIRTF